MWVSLSRASFDNCTIENQSNSEPHQSGYAVATFPWQHFQSQGSHYIHPYSSSVGPEKFCLPYNFPAHIPLLAVSCSLSPSQGLLLNFISLFSLQIITDQRKGTNRILNAACSTNRRLPECGPKNYVKTFVHWCPWTSYPSKPIQFLPPVILMADLLRIWSSFALIWEQTNSLLFHCFHDVPH